MSFLDLRSVFSRKGVIVTKVSNESIAFLKTKILRPALSITNTPFKNVIPQTIVLVIINQSDRCGIASFLRTFFQVTFKS